MGKRHFKVLLQNSQFRVLLNAILSEKILGCLGCFAAACACGGKNDLPAAEFSFTISEM
jgi:hypothetical protein